MSKTGHSEHHPSAEQGLQRNLYRLFALASVCSALLLLVTLSGAIHLILSRHMIHEAEEQSSAIARSLLAQERELFTTLVDVPATDPPPPETMAAFDRRVRRTLGFFDVLKVKIFSKEGRIVYCNEPGIIGRKDPHNRDLQRALTGEPVSLFQQKGEIWDLKNEKQFNVEVVETYLPIDVGKGEIAGAFEIYLDVSHQRQAMHTAMVASTMVLLGVLVVVFGVLLLFMRKATAIIYAKNRELKLLGGLLPICSYCKRIRNEGEGWEPLERYISSRSDSDFSHTVCPECMQEHYSD